MVISASTAGAAGTLRVQVWRKLRSLGALYLQQSVCLLPARDDVVRQVRRLSDRIHQQGGSVRVLRMRFADPVEEVSPWLSAPRWTVPAPCRLFERHGIGASSA